MRPITDISQTVKRFRVYLTVERGLSQNTALAYACDVEKLIDYVRDEGVAVEDVSPEHLHHFLCTLHDVGISPRSQARIISGIKSFFKFLKLEGYVDANPSLLLEAPKTGRRLPDVLSVEEIDQMMECIDMSKPDGQRNRAMVETLYSCGLRVSELISLRISQVFEHDEYIIVEGKGNKQRIVPISQEALTQINAYISQTRGIVQPTMCFS